MTDAQEIIVGACFDRETAGLQAIAIMNAITAAGFRIIGKDEVDHVTSPDFESIDVPPDVQEYGEHHNVTTLTNAAYRSGFADGHRAAIRAIGRKA